MPVRPSLAPAHCFASAPESRCLTTRYDLSTDEYRTKGEEKLLRGKVAERMQTFSNKPEFDMTLPTVLAAHLHVRGSEAHSFYKLSPRDDVHVDLGGLSTS